ncbi:MAG TPA: tetratricopeptide repeat protein, partial [Pyrinomonadaceae bacterium]|nr:tetratricopeptide repeat protein [Pyrinomonadaceae bacterium]
PDDYGFLRTEAMVLVELGRADEGVGLIRSLIGKQDPKAPSIMYDDFSNFLYISILYSEARRGKDAIAAANEAIAVSQDPERKQIALLSLATAQNVSKDFAAAESTLRGILKQTPKNPIALNNLGYFLADRNEKLEEALKLIQEALEIDPGNPSFLDSLGWAYFKLGKYDLAAASLIKALKADPASATAHHHLGDVYEKQGKIESARQSWQRALVLAVDPVEIAALKSKLSVKKTK